MMRWCVAGALHLIQFNAFMCYFCCWWWCFSRVPLACERLMHCYTAYVEAHRRTRGNEQKYKRRAMKGQYGFIFASKVILGNESPEAEAAARFIQCIDGGGRRAMKRKIINMVSFDPSGWLRQGQRGKWNSFIHSSADACERSIGGEGQTSITLVWLKLFVAECINRVSLLSLLFFCY